MTINQLYKNLNEGKITKSNFMFQLRKDPIASAWINGFTQYDSAIRILESKNILPRKVVVEEVKPTPKIRSIETVTTVLQEIRDTYKHGATINDVVKFVACTKLTEEEADEVQIRFLSEGLGVETNPEVDQYNSRVAGSLERKYNLDPTLIDHLLSTYPKIIEMGMKSGDSPEYTAENIMTMDEIEPRGLNEGAIKSIPMTNTPNIKTAEQISLIDKLNPQEVRFGIDCEVAKGKEIVAALKIVLKNLEKDPIYYTNELAGVKIKDKRTDLMVPVDKKATNTVDKGNAVVVAIKTEKGDSAKESNEEVKPVSGVKQETMVAKSGKGITKLPVPAKNDKIIKLKESLTKLVNQILKEELR